MHEIVTRPVVLCKEKSIPCVINRGDNPTSSNNPHHNFFDILVETGFNGESNCLGSVVLKD